MKNWKMFALCAACLATLSFAMPDYADAARLGGGRSFGSSSIMSRPATPPSGAFRGGSSSVQRQAPMASTANGGAATMARNNTGLLGGLFGGLLAGTVLGSLFGGHGMAGGMMGGLLNIIILGLIVYFGVRMFRRFRGTQASSDNGTYRSYDAPRDNEAPRQYDQGGAGAWDNLRSEQPAQQAAEQASIRTNFCAAPRPPIRAFSLRGIAAISTILPISPPKT